MNWKQNVLAVATFSLLALPGYSQPAPSGAQPPKGSSTTGTGASSQTTPPTSTTGAGASSKTGAATSAGTATPNRTATLVYLIYHANEGEIEMANLAKQNGTSAQVKNYADQVIKDHKAEETQVMAFADSHNIDLAAVRHQMQVMRDQKKEQTKRQTLDDNEARGVGSATGEWMAEPGTGAGGPQQAWADHNASMEKLSTLKGAEFDREFAKAMVKDHKATIDWLTTARTRVNDPEAVALVDKLLPMSKQHLTMAQKLQETLSKPS
jgi:predicted outer membrane protein